MSVAKNKALRFKLREKELVNVALSYDLPMFDLYKRNGITVNSETLMNFVKKWAALKKQGQVSIGVLRQLEASFNFLQTQMPLDKIISNVALMRAAVMTRNDYIVKHLLDLDYDMYLREKQSGEMPAFLAFSSDQFALFELFLQYGFDPKEVTDIDLVGHFLSAMKYRLNNMDTKAHKDLIMQLRQSPFNGAFLDALNKHPEGASIMKSFEMIGQEKYVSKIVFYILEKLALFFVLVGVLYPYSDKIEFYLAKYFPERPEVKLKKKEKLLDTKVKIKLKVPKVKDPVIDKILLQKRLKEREENKFSSRLIRFLNTLYRKLVQARARVSIIETNVDEIDQLQISVSNTKKLIVSKPHRKNMLPLKKAIKKPLKHHYPVKMSYVDSQFLYLNTSELTSNHAQRDTTNTDQVFNDVATLPPIKESAGSSQSSDIKMAQVHEKKSSTVALTLQFKTELYSTRLAKSALPYQAQVIYRDIGQEKYHTLAVGGIVRDAVYRQFHGGQEDLYRLSDLDFVTRAGSQEILNKYPRAHLNMDNRLFQFKIIDRDIDIYRSESFERYENMDEALQADAQTRAFTIDKLYAILVGEEWLVIDVTGFALKHIAQRVLATDNDPNEVFSADPLNILRAIYYSIEKGFIFIDPLLEVAIEKNKQLISQLIPERLNAFIFKLNKAQYKEAIWQRFAELNIIDEIKSVINRNKRVEIVEKLNAVINPMDVFIERKRLENIISQLRWRFFSSTTQPVLAPFSSAHTPHYLPGPSL